MDIEPTSDSSERFKLYDELELQEFQDKFVIKSHQSPNEGFWISRVDGNINLLDGDTVSESPTKTSTIYGVVGTIRLVVGTYAIVITSRKEVGSFLGFPVYRLMSMRVLACNQALKFSTSQEKKDEAYFLTLLKIVESMPGLYYSYETDITLNLQRRSKFVEGWISKPLWKQADPRYVWNKHLTEELIEFKLDRFIMPVVQGNILIFKLLFSLPRPLFVCVPMLSA
ncbi:putative phosphatidylinositol-3,4-bisphosphate 4-phosphatase [Medicago truncatula]|uniref:Putative phosphatidylinositol-3,4-bisphosphate 4-phosphatase n=1 Tax=Medicago truncatula TaxID=3880 RepID=A0A396GZP3_MEDTR|nr:putative phosphatidylinositol-3,4-bisphosphate 4-phosphatase [Medicago truncatula]